MNLSAFENPGKFWRGNIHTHSNLSDGLLDPGEVCRRYKNQGYDFISVTDHFIGLYDYPLTDTSGFRDENFTTLIGAELHSGALILNHPTPHIFYLLEIKRVAQK
jgi:predicted metal-dependent phosphoesterase TrpH